MKQDVNQEHDRWIEMNAKLNIAGALILIAITLLVIAYKLGS